MSYIYFPRLFRGRNFHHGREMGSQISQLKTSLMEQSQLWTVTFFLLKSASTTMFHWWLELRSRKLISGKRLVLQVLGSLLYLKSHRWLYFTVTVTRRDVTIHNEWILNSELFNMNRNIHFEQQGAFVLYFFNTIFWLCFYRRLD